MKNTIFPGASFNIFTIPIIKIKNINTLEIRMISPGTVS